MEHRIQWKPLLGTIILGAVLAIGIITFIKVSTYYSTEQTKSLSAQESIKLDEIVQDSATIDMLHSMGIKDFTCKKDESTSVIICSKEQK